MMLLNNFKRLILLIVFLQSTAFASDDEYDEDDLPYVEIKSLTDFSSIKTDAIEQNKIILLQMTASYCDYCLVLEEEIIKPMLRSGDYTERVFIRQVDIDGSYNISKDDDALSASELSEQLKVVITPTLLFIDGHGNEVSERILGVFSLDFYGGYVDQAIEEGLQTIVNQ